jgi:hypothetical protein
MLLVDEVREHKILLLRLLSVLLKIIILRIID